MDLVEIYMSLVELWPVQDKSRTFARDAGWTGKESPLLRTFVPSSFIVSIRESKHHVRYIKARLLIQN